MDKSSPIGVFDSGAGGISFLNEVCRRLPGEDYLYYGDIKNAPYGEKSEDEIRRYTHRACTYLFKHGVKAIVLACNTATSASIVELRDELSIPILSMEPAVKPALSVLDSGRVLTLATPATIAQPRYLRLLERLGAESSVVSVGCPCLAHLIDARASQQDIFSCLEQCLDPYFGQTFDAVVLGCTHYIFARKEIESFCRSHFSGRLVFFDGNEGTARQLGRVLTDAKLLNDNGGSVRFFTSGTRFQLNTLKSFYRGELPVK